MPINVATIPKKVSKLTKKKEESTRAYKRNATGPDPNAPQPPSPESDATDNDEEVDHATAPAAGSGSTGSASTVAVGEDTPKGKKTQKDASCDRLEVTRLLSGLFPSTYMNDKVKQLETTAAKKTKATTVNAATVKPRTKSATAIVSNPEDAIAQAIIENAFSATDAPVTPPANVPAKLETPKAPKKAAPAKKNKEKQNFNIIIHVEPKQKGQGKTQAQAQSPANDNDVSRRLDFGKKKCIHEQPIHEPIHENEDDSDDDYVPGCTDEDECSESCNSSSNSSNSSNSSDDYEDDYDDDEYDDDDSYYSSSSDDDCDPAEMEALQQKFTDEMKMMQSLRTTYEDMLAKDKTNRVVAKQLQTLKQSEEKIKKELDNLTYNQKRRNSKKFRKLLRKKNSTNDLEYFKKHLTIQQQRALIEEMNEVTKVTAIEKPYKLTLLESDIPRDMKAVAIRKVGMLQYMEPGCGEYCKLKNWVEAFMQIPFGKNKNLPLTISDGVDRCHDFMTVAKNRLDTAVYGLNDAKMQIMQMVGQWIANPAAIGTAVAIHGPPGTGKTSLVKEGISKILGRDFAFIALGGATDSSFLEGHSYTYEGSMWGKIVDILIRCKSSNPVIYFDELDKISETSKGEEIVGILTHLTDTSQNSQFHDKYFSEVAFDLSKCLFIFSYNDESRVNPVLLDRMYKIRTTGYSSKDKTFIAQNHLIPRIRAEVAFDEGDIIIPDSVVEYIVEHCTHKEAGVRNLKRCLEIIYTKLNLYRLMHPGTQLFEDKDMSLEVSFPYTVTREVVDKLIKKGETDRPNINMYL
jgi:ATP-dependent Lon protease